MSEEISTEDLIKQVRDPFFCGSEICFTMADRLKQQADEIKALRDALENIKKHQEFSMNGNYAMSATWSIAAAALKKDEDKNE